ncbi:MAG TPA: MOSC domain-containing protein, partial [Rubrobacteraceae bacterium]|nr:MOSC domain-containing protein [Rubrobacteraceae bacterium]
PNFVVRGCGPYAEDCWIRLCIGVVPFRVAEPCPRCAITTVDQETSTRGKEPLRTLATYRKSEGEVFFGRNLIHDTLGTVRVGDPVETMPR